MFQTKRSTKILSTGIVFILTIWLQCAILTVDSTSSSSSIIKPANLNPLINMNSNSSDQKQLLIESKSLINITIKPSTTKPFKFLDDYGELPELRDDDDDDNDPLFTTTIRTTTVKLFTQKTEIVKDSLSKAYPSLDKKEMQINKNAESNTIVADVSKTKAGKKESGKSVSSAAKIKETDTTTTKKQTNSVTTTPKINGTLPTSKVAGKTAAYPILDEEETLFQNPDEADEEHSTKKAFLVRVARDVPSTSKEGLQLGLFDVAEPIEYPVQDSFDIQSPEGSGDTSEPSTASTTTAISTTTSVSTPSPTTSTTKPTTKVSQTTAASTRAPTPTPTPTPPPAGTQEPDFGTAPPFKMEFNIGFSKPWNDGFSSCSSEECKSFNVTVTIEIKEVFLHCPGYKNVIVFNFFVQVSISKAQFLENAQFKSNGESGQNVYANYSVFFENQAVLQNSSAVVDYIETTAAPALEKADFNGSSVINGSTAGMSEVAKNQIKPFEQDPCTAIGDNVCLSICYPCVNEQNAPEKLLCKSDCVGANEICTVNETNQPGCTCKPNYLKVGSDCVDENLIIGLSVGIGAAVLLILVITSVVLCCQLDKKNKQSGNFLGSQGKSAQTSEPLKIPQNLKEQHDTDRDATEPTSFSAGEKEATQATEATTAADGAENQENSYNRRLSLVSNYPPGTLEQSAAYTNFVPQLQNVDDTKTFAIKRPKMLLRPIDDDLSITNFNDSFF